MTAFKDEIALNPKANADVMVVSEMVIPQSSIVSRILSTGSFLGSVRVKEPLIIMASSMPMPYWKQMENEAIRSCFSHSSSTSTHTAKT